MEEEEDFIDDGSQGILDYDDDTNYLELTKEEEQIFTPLQKTVYKLKLKHLTYTQIIESVENDFHIPLNRTQVRKILQYTLSGYFIFIAPIA